MIKGLINKSYFRLFILVATTASLLYGCATTTYYNARTPTYSVSVNSFGNMDLNGKTYYIISANMNISNTDPEFREYASFISKSLTIMGAVETSYKEGADLCILLSYGIYDDSYTETVPIPVWGQTGVKSISTTSSTTFSSYGGYGNATTNSTTKVKPQYGITGYSNVDRTVEQYLRVLNIYAYDNKNTNEATMVWKTNLYSRGSSSDLRKVVPYLAYCAWKYIGNSSDGIKSFVFLENDYIFNLWKQDYLAKKTINIVPDYSSSSFKNIYVSVIDHDYSYTYIVLTKSECLNTYSINSNSYLEYNGQKYNLIDDGSIKLNQEIKNECGLRYFLLKYPKLPSNAKSVNLRNLTMKGGDIMGIQLK